MYDSDIKKLLRVLRSRWWLILASVVVCAGGAAVYASTREAEYAADTQLFVSAALPAAASRSATSSGICSVTSTPSV